jgi:hypothetical protein
MSSALEVEFLITQDLVDMFFPTYSRLGMSLESMLNREDHRAVKVDFLTILVPFGIGVINTDVGRDRRSGGMGVCIGSIATKNLVVQTSGKGNE